MLLTVERPRIGPPTKTRPDPDQSVRAAGRGKLGGREGGREGVVRGPLDVSTKSNSAGRRLENQRRIESWMAEKVLEGGFLVEGSILVRRIGGVCVSRGGVAGGAGVVRDGGDGVLLSAKKQRLRACRKLINECCLMGYSRAEFAPVGWVKRRDEKSPRMELRLNEKRTPKTPDQGGEAGLVRY